METSELIKSLGVKLGIQLKPNDDGFYSFEADDLAITIFDLLELDSIALNGDLGLPPPEAPEALYKAMLEANHLFRDTNGATISLNPDNGHIEICKALHCKLMDADLFFTEVERFVNLMEVWSNLVKNYRGSSSDDSIPSLDTRGFMQV